MKILLLNPPRFDMTKYGLSNINAYGPPLGVASLAAVLEKDGYNVRAVDFYYESWEKVKEIITTEAPHIVGITILSQQRASVYRLVRLIKEINPDIKIILGGVHAHFMYEQILENFPVDFIVRGEGEETFLELIRTLEQNLEIDNIKGIVFRRDGKIVKTQDRIPINNLDELPFPAYHFFNLDGYSTFENLRGEIHNGIKLEKLKFATYVFSRGCPGRCIFCSTYKFWGYKWRCRSPHKVADDLEILRKEYGREYINFVDDIFTVDKNKVIEICKEILERKLDILWDCETRVDFVSQDLLEWMRKAGCVSISYGVESAAPEILEALNKNAAPEKIIKAFKMTRDAGIKTKMFLIIGNPGESLKSVKITQDILRKTKPDFLTINPMMVFPGTDLCELAKAKNLCDDSYWLTEKPAPFYTAEIPLSRLKFYSDKLMSVNANFFVKLLRMIRSYIVLCTGLNISQKGIQKI